MGEHACGENIMLILILYEIYGNVFFRIHYTHVYMYIYIYPYEYSYIHVYYINILISYMDKVYDVYICYKDSYK